MNPDQLLFKIINQKLSAEWLDSVMVFASSKYGWLPLYAMIAVLLFYRQPWKLGLARVLLVVAAFGISDSFTSRVMKPLFKRQRPYTIEENNARLPLVAAEKQAKFISDNQKNYGFVSSHSANFFAIMLLASGLLGFRGFRKYALVFIAALVAYSRVYLGVHYPADVIVGGLVGGGIALGLFYCYKRWILQRLTQ
jgi:undecaprenyl-diphosphatase